MLTCRVGTRVVRVVVQRYSWYKTLHGPSVAATTILAGVVPLSTLTSNLATHATAFPARPPSRSM